MEERKSTEPGAILARIKLQAAGRAFRVTQHAQQEMVEEGIRLDEVIEVIARGEILEEYPGHRRGACCLVCGSTLEGRALHVVCTTAQPLLILITGYEPKPPKWATPQRRGSRT